jgi:hypothetical protein
MRSISLILQITTFLFLACTQIQGLTLPPQTPQLLDICPKLTVKCVIDGDWRHPVGKLGDKRESHYTLLESLFLNYLSLGEYTLNWLSSI